MLPRMADLTSSRVIKFKGWLFLFLGLVASFSLLVRDHSPGTVALLLIAIWSFCRFYYFAFYVIEHYVDGSFRFAGLWSFARYMVKRRSGAVRPPPER
jgi:hypothetical protein